MLHAGETSGIVKIVSKNTESISIQIDGKAEEYKILKVFEFTSDRKMMSVIVKRVADNKIFTFTKGADEKLVPLAAPTQNQAEIQSLKQNVDSYAQLGYRTLAFAMREIK